MARLSLAFDILARDRDASRTLDKIARAADNVGRSGNRARIGIGLLAAASSGLVPSTLALAGSLTQVAAGTAALAPAAVAGAVAGFAALKVGLSGVGAALKTKTMGDPKKFTASLKTLAPNARATVLAIKGLQPALTGLRKAVQQDLFAGMARTLRVLASRLLPSVRSGLSGIATAFNSTLKALANGLGRLSKTQLSAMFRNIANAVKAIGPAMRPAVRAFLTLSSVGSGFLPALARSLAAATAQFDRFVTSAAKSGGLRDFIAAGLAGMRSLAQAAIGAGSAIAGIVRAAQAAGGGSLQALATVLQNVARVVNGPAFQAGLTQFFTGLQAGTRALSASLPAVGAALAALAPALATLAGAAGAGLGDLLRSMSAAAVQLAPALTSVAKVIAAMAPYTTQLVIGFVAVTKAAALLSAIGKVGGLIAWLTGIRLVTAATKIWAGVQIAFNAIMSANPIGLVIVGVAALVAGIVIAYKRSETFRNIVNGAFKSVGQAATFLWNSVLKPTFKFIVSAFLAVAGGIVNGAAWAFGWIPGLGPRLKAAAAQFNAFRDRVNASLAGTQAVKRIIVSAAGASTVIQQLADIKYRLDRIPRSVTIGVNNKLAGMSGAAFRADGGPVRAGMPYIVGERRPELFVPDRNGTVLPSVPGLGSGPVTLSRQSIEALGREIQRRPVAARIAVGSVDRALGAGAST